MNHKLLYDITQSLGKKNYNSFYTNSCLSGAIQKEYYFYSMYKRTFG